MPRSQVLSVLWKSVAILAGVLVVTLVTIVGVTAYEHNQPLVLPPPSGPLPVGRTVVDWRDSTAVDSLAPQPGTRREVLAWIWYPAPAPSASLDSYVPKALQGAPARTAPFILRLLTRDYAKVYEHTTEQPISNQQRAFPVLILRAGASAPVLNYSMLAIDLASHGYIVVGFDAPYRTGSVTFPDGRHVPRLAKNNPELAIGSADSAQLINSLSAAWTRDIGFVLDRLAIMNADRSSPFAGHLDLNHVGVFGHSFGGSVALGFCAVDARCKAGVDIDGALVGSGAGRQPRQPFMFLLSDHSHESDPAAPEILARIRRVYDRSPADGRAMLEIRGANHFTFSDDGAFLKAPIIRSMLRLIGKLGIDGPRQIAVTAYALRNFFDAHLSGRSSAIVSSEYSELRDVASPAN